LRARVFARYGKLVAARSHCSAFHPHGGQIILDIHPTVFAIERISPDERSRALCLHNISAEEVHFNIDYKAGKNLFTNDTLQVSKVTLEPYQILWMSL
jgi:hypothetical protein